MRAGSPQARAPRARAPPMPTRPVEMTTTTLDQTVTLPDSPSNTNARIMLGLMLVAAVVIVVDYAVATRGNIGTDTSVYASFFESLRHNGEVDRRYSPVRYLIFAPVLLLNSKQLRVAGILAFLAYCSGVSLVLVRALVPAVYTMVMAYDASASYTAGVRLDFA